MSILESEIQVNLKISASSKKKRKNKFEEFDSQINYYKKS